jgi:uncharacterized protein YceK
MYLSLNLCIFMEPFMKSLILVAIISLSGCATIQEHPYITGFGAALVAGSIMASTSHDNRTTPEMRHIGNPNCANGACQ